jgi:hypothetical protein
MKLSAVWSVSCQASSVCPGSPKIRSRLSRSNPASRAKWMLSSACCREWILPSNASSLSEKDCTPTAQTVNTHGAQRVQFLRVQGAGVSFQAYLSSRADTKRPARFLQQFPYLASFHERRRAAAKVNSIRCRRSIASSQSELANFLYSCVHISRQKIKLPGVSDKITVVTPPHTKRNVKVDTKHASILTVLSPVPA